MYFSSVAKGRGNPNFSTLVAAATSSKNLAMADCESSASRARKGKAIGGVDDLIEKLKLNEREDDELNFDEEFPDEVDVAEFMVIAKVHTEKPFSRTAFYETMKRAWSLAQGASFSALGENLFVITVNCLGDWQRVMEQGPWLFRDHVVLIEAYDGFTDMEDVVLEKISV